MSQATSHADDLVGNRCVLVGGVVYLLEWVAIIWVGAVGLGAFVTRGATGPALVNTYADHPDAMFAMAGRAPPRPDLPHERGRPASGAPAGNLVA